MSSTRKDELSEEKINYPDKYNCPITADVMSNPVMTTCGHHYEKTAIEQYIGTKNNVKCPCCNGSLSKDKLFPSYFMKSEIEAFKKNHSQNKQKEDEITKLKTEVERLNMLVPTVSFSSNSSSEIKRSDNANPIKKSTQDTFSQVVNYDNQIKKLYRKIAFKLIYKDILKKSVAKRVKHFQALREVHLELKKNYQEELDRFKTKQINVLNTYLTTNEIFDRTTSSESKHDEDTATSSLRMMQSLLSEMSGKADTTKAKHAEIKKQINPIVHANLRMAVFHEKAAKQINKHRLDLSVLCKAKDKLYEDAAKKVRTDHKVALTLFASTEKKEEKEVKVYDKPNQLLLDQALVKALKERNHQQVESLLQQGADPNVKSLLADGKDDVLQPIFMVLVDYKGERAFAKCVDDNIDLKSLDLLIKHKVNVNVRNSQSMLTAGCHVCKDSNNPLMVVVRALGNEGGIKNLRTAFSKILATDININEKVFDKRTALHMFMFRSPWDLSNEISQLITKGADHQSKDVNGRTPLRLGKDGYGLSANFIAIDILERLSIAPSAPSLRS